MAQVAINENRVKLSAADDFVEWDGYRAVLGIFWVSDAATDRDIAADDDFLLEDGEGYGIISRRCEALTEDTGLQVVIPYPGLPVKSGLKAEVMDGGVCWVWLAPEN